jgi:phosphatidylinositol 4-kinase
MAMLINILRDTPYADFDRSLAWTGMVPFYATNIEPHYFPCADWALPDQLVFSIISALLRLSNEHPAYRDEATSAIFSFVSQTVEQIYDNSCTFFFILLYVS